MNFGGSLGDAVWHADAVAEHFLIHAGRPRLHHYLRAGAFAVFGGPAWMLVSIGAPSEG